jgi:hypothetical protein
MIRFAMFSFSPARIALLVMLSLGFMISTVSCEKSPSEPKLSLEPTTTNQSLAGFFSEREDLNDIPLNDPAIDRTMSMISNQLEGMLEEAPAYTKATHFVLSHPFDTNKASCLPGPDHINL